MDTTSVNGPAHPRAKAENTFPQSTMRQSAINLLSGFNAVTCYQPFRFWATQYMRNEPVSFNPKHMFKGFIPQLFTAHQLVIMGFTDRMISQYLFKKNNEDMSFWELLFKGSVSGIASAPSVTPLEALNIRRQFSPSDTASKVAKISMKGLSATLMRNWGVGLGMFTIPEFFKRAVDNYVPKEFLDQHPTFSNVACCLMGGFVATIVTQAPDVARVKLQSLAAKNASEAFKMARKEMFTASGKKALLCRMGILGVASVVMNQSRSYYEKVL